MNQNVKTFSEWRYGLFIHYGLYTNAGMALH